MKDAAPQRRDGIWSDFNSRSHEHIVSGEGEIVPNETIHRKEPENVWSKQLVPDLKCALLDLRGGDAATGHMVAEDRGEGQAGEPFGADRQVGRHQRENAWRVCGNTRLPRMPSERCDEHRGMPRETHRALVERA